MSKLNSFVKVNKFGYSYRPSLKDLNNLVQNSKNILKEIQIGSKLSDFCVYVKSINNRLVNSSTPTDSSLYANLSMAVFNIDSIYDISSDDDVDLVLSFKETLSNGDVISHNISDLFNEVLDVDSSEEEVVDVKPTLKELNDEFVKEWVSATEELKQTEILDIQNVEKRSRKYLTSVENPIHVFSDFDNISDELAQEVHEGIKNGIIPTHYDENGDIYLNPLGSVLKLSLTTLLEKHSESFKVSGTHSGTVNYAQAVVGYLLLKMRKEGRDYFTIHYNRVLYSVIKHLIDLNEIQDIVYDVSQEEFESDVTMEQLLKTLEREDGKVSYPVLFLCIDTIIADNLFNVKSLGLPKLTSKIQRVSYLDLIRGIV